MEITNTEVASQQATKKRTTVAKTAPATADLFKTSTEADIALGKRSKRVIVASLDNTEKLLDLIGTTVDTTNDLLKTVSRQLKPIAEEAKMEAQVAVANRMLMEKQLEDSLVAVGYSREEIKKELAV